MWCMWKRLHPNFIPCSTSEKPRWEKYSDTVTQVTHATVAAHSSLNWSHPGAHPDCLNCGLGLHLQLLVIRSLLEDTESGMNYLLHSRRWWAENLFDRRTTWVLSVRNWTWNGLFSPIGFKWVPDRLITLSQDLMTSPGQVAVIWGLLLWPLILPMEESSIVKSYTSHCALYTGANKHLLNTPVRWPSQLWEPDIIWISE